MKMRIFLGAFLLLFGGAALAQSNAKPDLKQTTARVEVLDFHNEHRCPTCLEIERLTKKILKEAYADQSKKGQVQFFLINVDEKDNLELVRKYKAYGSTLIIRSYAKGKEEYVDLTNFAFMNFNKEQKFTATLKKELNAALQRIKS